MELGGGGVSWHDQRDSVRVPTPFQDPNHFCSACLKELVITAATRLLVRTLRLEKPFPRIIVDFISPDTAVIRDIVLSMK